MRLEDALSLYITVDDGLFFEKKKRLLDLDRETISTLVNYSVVSSDVKNIIDLADCWEFLLSVPGDIVDDNNMIRVLSKYEGFLDGYEGF